MSRDSNKKNKKSNKGKKEVVGTSRTGRPITKNQYIKRKKREARPTGEEKLIRLNKYISNSGICSRRDADIYIKAGSVTVNGEAITEMGYKVKPDDDVRFDGARIEPEEKVYYVLNKPKGYITLPPEKKGTKTVMELIEHATPAKIRPVGRLERPALGLLLFTNDRKMEQKLSDENREIRRIYHVALNRNFDPADLQKLQEETIYVTGKPVKIADANFVDGGRSNEVGIEIYDNRDQIVSKVFKSMGYNIEKLDRVVFGTLTKKDLPRGHFRILTKQEIANLQMI